MELKQKNLSQPTVTTSKEEELQRAREYQTLKARNEWIKLNQKRLDDIEAHRLRAVRWLIFISLINLFVSLFKFLGL